MSTSSTEHETIVFRLAQILIKLNQGQRIVAKDLAEEFGVNLRTIQRDLNQRFAYLPLMKDGGGYKLDGIALGKLSTKDIHRFAELTGIQGLFPSLGEEFLRDLFDQHLSATMLVKGHHYEDISGRHADFKLLEKAIADATYVTLAYKSPTSKRRGHRSVAPYRLLNNKGIWYLAATENGKLKTFAFSGVTELRATEETFKVSQDINARLNSEDGIWISDKAIEVVLKVSAEVAGYFKRRSLIANQVIDKELSDGALLVSAKVGHINQILPVVRYWIPHIRIISPDLMQKQLEQELMHFSTQTIN